MLRLSRTWPFLLTMLLIYLAPAAAGAASPLFGSAADPTAVARGVWGYLALFIYPVACMVVGFFAGWKQGAVWLVPILIAALSLPFSLYYLGRGADGFGSAFTLFAIYLGFGFTGWFFGWQVHRRQSATQS